MIHIQAKVVEPNLALRPHLTGQLAEAEDPPEARRFDSAATGVAEDDLGRQTVDAPLGIGMFMRPMPPALIVLDELRMLAVYQFPVCAPGHVSIQHPLLDGEAPFGEVLPGMPRLIGAQWMPSRCRQGLSARNTPALSLTTASSAPHCVMPWLQTWTTWERFWRSKQPAPTSARL